MESLFWITIFLLGLDTVHTITVYLVMDPDRLTRVYDPPHPANNHISNVFTDVYETPMWKLYFGRQPSWHLQVHSIDAELADPSDYFYCGMGYINSGNTFSGYLMESTNVSKGIRCTFNKRVNSFYPRRLKEMVSISNGVEDKNVMIQYGLHRPAVAILGSVVDVRVDAYNPFVLYRSSWSDPDGANGLHFMLVTNVPVGSRQVWEITKQNYKLCFGMRSKILTEIGSAKVEHIAEIGIVSDGHHLWWHPMHAIEYISPNNEVVRVSLEVFEEYKILTTWVKGETAIRLKVKNHASYSNEIYVLKPKVPASLPIAQISNTDLASDFKDICPKIDDCPGNHFCYYTKEDELDYRAGYCLHYKHIDRITSLYKDKRFQKIAVNSPETYKVEFQFASANELCVAIVVQQTESATDFQEAYVFDGERFWRNPYFACRRIHSSPQRRSLFMNLSESGGNLQFTGWRQGSAGAMLRIPTGSYRTEMWALLDRSDKIRSKVVQELPHGLNEICLDNNTCRQSNHHCSFATDMLLGICLKTNEHVCVC